MTNNTHTTDSASIGLLTGKVLFITGASRGIGAAAARLFASEGAAVVLAARSTDALDRIVQEIRADGQVGQGEQGLTSGRKAPPPRSDLLPPGCQLPGQEPQGAAGQINRGRVDKHAKLLADTGDLGREPVYQELRRCAGQSNSRSAPPA